MTWGLALFVLAVVFLIGHLLIDGYRMFRNVRRLRHVKYKSLDTERCERCYAIALGLADMRHEVIWTVAAVVALSGHITLDFVS